jgi:hypothetical protein
MERKLGRGISKDTKKSKSIFGLEIAGTMLTGLRGWVPAGLRC